MEPTRSLTKREMATYRKLSKAQGKAFDAYDKLNQRYRRLCARLEADGARVTENGVSCIRTS
jgi:hypothetical protein